MKIRKLVVIYTFVYAIAVVIALFVLQKNDRKPINIIEANRSYQQVLQEMQELALFEGADPDGAVVNDRIQSLEEQYQCQILPIYDRYYDSKLMSALSRGDIIFDITRDGQLTGKIIFPREGPAYEGLRSTLLKSSVLIALFLLLIGYLLIFIIYRRIIGPFNRLERFAAEVARGNLDLPLKRTRDNYFGAFTESFDLMREELKKARENEYLANIRKKELVASLSHDIKTPVATIKAACELLQLKASKEGPAEEADIQKKWQIIADKADLIDRLVSDMFQATLAELELLSVQPEAIASHCIVEMLSGLEVYGAIEIVLPVPSCLIIADPMRLNQIIDNIIINSYKYGKAEHTKAEHTKAGHTKTEHTKAEYTKTEHTKAEITVTFSEQSDGLTLRIRDHGEGIFPEELALVTGKFYRGTNAEGKEGSGLGLYLANYFVEQMGGKMECYCEQGFVVSIFLKKA
ncbi:MAG: HAMP domain-containing histidine kinase [Lachnospiraceae bacterium]|jgi:signal transduction histidine kinase|nr:HAMP domain-containing histidine kinase [Lachnospiraceae bacterium]